MATAHLTPYGYCAWRPSGPLGAPKYLGRPRRNDLTGRPTDETDSLADAVVWRGVDAFDGWLRSLEAHDPDSYCDVIGRGYQLATLSVKADFNAPVPCPSSFSPLVPEPEHDSTRYARLAAFSLDAGSTHPVAGRDALAEAVHAIDDDTP